MLTVVTRKDQLLEAFRSAGLRGLTAAEMEAAVGAFWRLRLGELKADGYVFCEHSGRRGRTFRWVLALEPSPAPVAGDDALFVPPPPPPADAIWGEIEGVE